MGAWVVEFHGPHRCVGLFARRNCCTRGGRANASSELIHVGETQRIPTERTSKSGDGSLDFITDILITA